MSPHQQPRSTNLRKQLLLAISPFLVAVSLLVLLAFETTSTLSALRAYVEGESLWTSAQKEASRRLEVYAATGDESEYAAFQREIQVPLGDRRARLELDKQWPDLGVARAGFLVGRNHPDDIDGLILLYRRFRQVDFFQKAIAIWAEGDRQIDEIIAASNQLHASFEAAEGSSDRARPIAPLGLERARAADDRVTPLEVAFSSALGDASRRARTVLQVGALALAVILALVKLAFSRWMLRQHIKIEEALRASEERFDMAVRGSNDGIWNWAPEENDVYLSPRAIELLGYPMYDLPRQPAAMLPLVHAEDRAAVRLAVETMLELNNPLDVEFRFLDWGGNYRWVHLRGRPVRMRASHILRVAGSITDISERKRIEALIRQLALDEQHRSEQAQIALLEQVQAQIGRELHDDLGQRLTGIAFLAKALEQRLAVSTPGEKDQTTWIVKLMNEAIDRVRFLSRQLSPIELDEVSLGTALKRLADDVHEIFGTRIKLRLISGDVWMPAEHANQLFRIAQESISNALRHGHATEIRVYLSSRKNGTRLAVSDNGVGFAVKANHDGRLGLRSMRIRAQTLRGRFGIRSGTRGTTVIVRCEKGVPLGTPSNLGEVRFA